MFVRRSNRVSWSHLVLLMMGACALPIDAADGESKGLPLEDGLGLPASHAASPSDRLWTPALNWNVVAEAGDAPTRVTPYFVASDGEGVRAEIRVSSNVDPSSIHPGSPASRDNLASLRRDP